MKTVVGRELCIGCGLCAQICPDVFNMDDDVRAGVKLETVPTEFQKSCDDAAGECPVSAISVT